MTPSSNHGAATRRPVVYGGRKIRGLHVRTLKDGSEVYEARLRIDGKDCTVVLDSVTTATEAVRELENLRADRNRGVEHENPLINPLISELAAEWLAHCEARIGLADEKLRLSPATVYQRRSLIHHRVLPVIGRKRVGDLTTVDLRRLIDVNAARGLAPKTLTATLSSVSIMLTYAVKRGYVPHNVVRELPREDRPGDRRVKQPRYLTGAEIGKLLAAVPDTIRPTVGCMVYAGLRIGEARGLRWKDVDTEAGALTVAGQYNRWGYSSATKTLGSSAVVPLFPALARELAAHRTRQAQVNITLIGADRYVCTNPVTGLPYSDTHIGRTIRRAARKTGLDADALLKRVAPHDMRHSFIANAIHSGATIPETAELARHAGPAVTLNTYAGLTADGRGRAASKMLDVGYGA